MDINELAPGQVWQGNNSKNYYVIFADKAVCLHTGLSNISTGKYHLEEFSYRQMASKNAVTRIYPEPSAEPGTIWTNAYGAMWVKAKNGKIVYISADGHPHVSLKSEQELDNDRVITRQSNVY